MNKILINLVLASIITLILISSVAALGITPGRTNIDFKPNEKQTLKVTIVNSENKDLSLLVQTRGDLSNNIILSQESISIKSSEYEKSLTFDLVMPDSLSPGLHTAEVVVVEASQENGKSPASVGVALAVATQIYVRVPYPGKYVEGEIKIMGGENEKKIFIVAINRGTEKINEIKANIVILDSEGKKVEKLETDKTSLTPGEQKDILATWKVNSPKGRYTARAEVIYDGERLALEKNFEIGELLLELLDLYVKDFVLGEIAKFNLVVRNKWSEPINKAYAEMLVLDSNYNELADVKSSTYDIPADKQTTMVYYWDTKEVKEGLYNANVLLYYGDKKTQHDLKLDVSSNAIEVIGLGRVISSEESSSSSNIVTILVIIIGFLVLLNLLWFLVLRKRRK